MDVSPETAKALTERIQDAGTEVVKAKVPYIFSYCHILQQHYLCDQHMYKCHHGRFGAPANLVTCSLYPSQ